MRMVSFVATLILLVCVPVAHAYAQSDFYKGKTITVVQIVDAGGTGDLRRRALFPFLQKYIPGNPTIVSDYMPGGGGRKAANHIYRVAKPDGLTIGGMSSSLVTNAILDTTGVQYDIDKLTYLGSPVSIFHYVLLTRKEAGLGSLEKLRGATGVRIGAQEVGHDIYITGRLFAYLIGLKDPRFVTGYGGPEIDIAMERRELDGRANALETLGQRNAEEMKKDCWISMRSSKSPSRKPAGWLCALARNRKFRQVRDRAQTIDDVSSFPARRHTLRARAGHAQTASADPSRGFPQSASRSGLSS